MLDSIVPACDIFLIERLGRLTMVPWKEFATSSGAICLVGIPSPSHWKDQARFNFWSRKADYLDQPMRWCFGSTNKIALNSSVAGILVESFASFFPKTAAH